MTSIVRLIAYFTIPIVVTITIGYALMEVLLRHLPATEGYVLTGIVVFAAAGYIAAKVGGRQGGGAVLAAAIFFAMLYSGVSFYLAPPSQKTPILVALGFWAVPFSCLICILLRLGLFPFSQQLQSGDTGSTPNNSFKPKPLRGSA